MSDSPTARSARTLLRKLTLPVERWLAKGGTLLVMATLAAAAIIVMLEVDRILGSIEVDGRVHTLASIFAPPGSPMGLPEALGDWSESSGAGLLRSWIVVYTFVDLLFIAAYTAVAFGVRRRVGNPWNERSPGDQHAATTSSGYSTEDRRWLISWQSIAVLAIADLVEDVLTLVLMFNLPDPPTAQNPWVVSAWLLIPLVASTVIKWIAVVVVLGSVIYGTFTLPKRREVLGRWGLAIKMQRFSLVIVGLMAVLMIAPGPDIFDQASDIERTWLLRDGMSDGSATQGWIHLLFAVVGFGLLTGLLLYIGNLRTARARDAYPESEPGTEKPQPECDNREKAWPIGWLVAALALPAGAIVLGWFGWVRVNCWAVGAVAAVPLAIFLINLFVSWRKVPVVEVHRTIYPRVARAVGVVGDLVGFAVVAVFGLSLVRAFTAPVVLDVEPGWAIGAVSVGLLVAIVVWMAASPWIRRRFQEGPRRRSGCWSLWVVLSTPFRCSERRRLIVLVITALVLIVPASVFPQPIGGFVGVLGIFAWGLTALSLILAILALLAQTRQPLRVFRMLGLDTTPMVTILALAVLMASVPAMLGHPSMSHRIREPGLDNQQAAWERWHSTTFEQSVADWLLKADPGHSSAGAAGRPGQQDCAIPAGQLPGGRGLKIKPMIFVAAEGGGIRAAWWTVLVASELSGSRCAEQAVLAASGASGGAVGLAVMYASPDPVSVTETLASAAPLAEAVDGLVLRDSVAGLSGIDLGALGTGDADRFPDRAALLEQSWERSAPALAEPFPAKSKADGQPGGEVSWRTFLNSTSARTGCRVVISDVDTSVGSSAERHRALESTDCERPEGDSGISGSYNLFAAQPCLAGIRTSTAALLASRFPYVTPSGVTAANCPGIADPLAGVDQSDQLIDGGYADNSGIGTLIELSTQVMPRVQAFNARQLDGSDNPVTLVVPMVISIENTPQHRSELPTPDSAAPELTLPITSILRGGAMLNDPDTLLERMAETTENWLPEAGITRELVDRVKSRAAAVLGNRRIVVAPRSSPGVAAPLGWTMSAASLARMQSALDELIHCNDAAPAEDCRFAKLLTDLKGSAGN